VSARWRLLVVIAGAVAAVVLFFVFRGDGEDGNEKAETARTGTSERLAPQETILRITIRGASSQIMRATVPKGRRVVVIVSADRSDEVHVHGYDLEADVTPSRPARIAFRADESGRFEIEFENSGEQIAELTVNP
jgi:hypothetical protein